MNKHILSISEAASVLGVSDETLRNWGRDGKLTPFYTNGGHRRYYKTDLELFAGITTQQSPKNRVAIYCRVSSHDQKIKGDLERQVGRVVENALKRNYEIKHVITEVGSGMNDNRRKLKELFSLVENKEIDIVLIEHKDRLTRFCFKYLCSYFNSYGCRIEWIEDTLGKTYEQELVEDVLSLLTCFSAKIYGKRSHSKTNK